MNKMTHSNEYLMWIDLGTIYSYSGIIIKGQIEIITDIINV